MEDLCGGGTADFSARLRQVCKEQRISQKDLALATGLSRSSISDYARGVRSPDYKRLSLIAQALNVSASHLICDESEALEIVQAFSKVVNNARYLNSRQRRALVRALVKAEIDSGKAR